MKWLQKKYLDNSLSLFIQYQLSMAKNSKLVFPIASVGRDVTWPIWVTCFFDHVGSCVG